MFYMPVRRRKRYKHGKEAEAMPQTPHIQGIQRRIEMLKESRSHPQGH